MGTSERFLAAYGQIEGCMRRRTADRRHRSFYELVEALASSDAAVRRYAIDLKEYADLRNAIVHERGDGRVIAEPNEAATDDLERIASHLLNPPRVYPLFQTTVQQFDESDSIWRAAAEMRSHRFSQAPVRGSDAIVALLTVNTIARWIGSFAGSERLVPDETTISEVLAHAEDQENYSLMRRDATVFEALEAFQTNQAKGKRLEAILITHAARRSEKPIGIITVADLPRALAGLAKSAAASGGPSA